MAKSLEPQSIENSQVQNNEIISTIVNEYAETKNILEKELV